MTRGFGGRKYAASFHYGVINERTLKTVEKKVRAVLEKNEDARNDDMVLYLALCNVSERCGGNPPCGDNDTVQVSWSAEL